MVVELVWILAFTDLTAEVLLTDWLRLGTHQPALFLGRIFWALLGLVL